MRICDCLTSMFCLAEALAWVTQIMEVGMGQAGHRCGRAWMISLGMAPIELLGSGARLMGRTATQPPRSPAVRCWENPVRPRGGVFFFCAAKPGGPNATTHIPPWST